MNQLIGTLRLQKSEAFRLFAFSFLILFFELALIRFVPATVRVAAYFINLVLIAAFLGMGTGLILEIRRKNFTFLFFPFLLVLTGTCFYFANIVVQMPVGETEGFYLIYSDLAPAAKRWGVLPVLSILFVTCSLVFVPLGLAMGRAFSAFPPLVAYSLNITGSLAGILVFALLSYGSTPPLLWFLAGGLAMTAMSRTRLEWLMSALCFPLCLIIIWGMHQGDNEVWSPYYKINFFEEKNNPRVKSIHVNGSFHQHLFDFSDESARLEPVVAQVRQDYLAPYQFVTQVDEVLILGAGTGNDVSLALMQGAKSIDAVEIDPVILKLGHRLNPHRALDNPRVTPWVEDARAFLKHNSKQYDLIILGTLDSQTLLSGMSSLRLDNFVYTLESIQSIQAHLKPGGRLILYHLSPQPHIARKLYKILETAFGAPPRVRFQDPAGLFNYTFVAGQNLPPNSQFSFSFPGKDDYPVPTDDWPYLFLETPGISSHYLLTGGVIMLVTLLMVGGAWGGLPKGRPDGPLFFLGAGFLLLETKSVTEMSLLFGSTWQVNIMIFFSILLLILLANLLVLNFPRIKTKIVFFGLVLSIVLGYAFPVRWLVGLPLAAQWILGGIFTAIPLFFAGMLFAEIFKTRENSVSALGYNLVGSILGGLLEYSSMILGSKTLYLIALGMYITAYLLVRGESKGRRAVVH